MEVKKTQVVGEVKCNCRSSVEKWWKNQFVTLYQISTYNTPAKEAAWQTRIVFTRSCIVFQHGILRRGWSRELRHGYRLTKPLDAPEKGTWRTKLVRLPFSHLQQSGKNAQRISPIPKPTQPSTWRRVLGSAVRWRSRNSTRIKSPETL